MKDTSTQRSEAILTTEVAYIPTQPAAEEQQAVSENSDIVLRASTNNEIADALSSRVARREVAEALLRLNLVLAFTRNEAPVVQADHPDLPKEEKVVALRDASMTSITKTRAVLSAAGGYKHGALNNRDHHPSTSLWKDVVKEICEIKRSTKDIRYM